METEEKAGNCLLIGLFQNPFDTSFCDVFVFNVYCERLNDLKEKPLQSDMLPLVTVQ